MLKRLMPIALVLVLIGCGGDVTTTPTPTTPVTTDEPAPLTPTEETVPPTEEAQPSPTVEPLAENAFPRWPESIPEPDNTPIREAGTLPEGATAAYYLGVVETHPMPADGRHFALTYGGMLHIYESTTQQELWQAPPGEVHWAGDAVGLGRRLYDRASGDLLAEVRAPVGGIWSAEGTYYAVGRDRDVAVVDVAAGEVAQAFDLSAYWPDAPSGEWIVTFAISADESTLAASAYVRGDTLTPAPFIAVWDVATGDELGVIETEAGFRPVTLSSDGTLVGIPQRGLLWDVATGDVVFDDGRVDYMAWTDDTFITSGESLITIYEAATFELRHLIEQEEFRLNRLIKAHDGRALFLSGGALVLDIATGDVLAQVEGIQPIGATADYTHIMGTHRQLPAPSFFVWEGPTTAFSLIGNTAFPALVWSTDGDRFGAWGSVYDVWQGGEVVESYTVGDFTRANPPADGLLVRPNYAVDATTLAPLYVWETETIAANNGENTKQTVAGFVTISIYDLVNEGEPLVIEPEVTGAAPRALVWAPDGERLAIARTAVNLQANESASEVLIYEAATGRLLDNIPFPGRAIETMAWGSGGLAIGSGGTLFILDGETLTTLVTERFEVLPDVGITALAWSGDGRLAVAIGQRPFASINAPLPDAPTLFIWAGTFTPLPVDSGVQALAWSPDSSVLAASEEDGQIVFWEP